MTATPASDRAGRVAITGAASGFGRALAVRLHEAGHQVGLLDVDASAVAALASDLGERARAAECDVRSPASVGAAVHATAAAFGGLDGLVVSAGVIHFKPLAEVTEADWDLTLDVNLKGAFLACQAAAPHLVDSERGRIVLISSDAGRRGAPNIQAYAASKFGMIGLAESLAAELAPAGVTVNAVCPVACPTTGMGEQVLAWKSEVRQVVPAEVAAAAARGNPLGRNASEADVVAVIEFLLSDAAGFLTGVALDIDGGLHLGVLPGMA
jgi:NAD(P)-dependent dehydrogenase (short-subunit alcohol dehydrogenase family)